MQTCISLVAGACFVAILIAGCAESDRALRIRPNTEDDLVVVIKDGSSYSFPEQLDYEDSLWIRDDNSVRGMDSSVAMMYFCRDRPERLDYAIGAPGDLLKRRFQLRIQKSTFHWVPSGMTTSVLQDGSHIETPYVAGFARGVVRFYYPNGNLKYEGNEISGSREGKFKGYYETGEIWWAASFSDDEYVEGSAVVWDKDGNVLSIEPLEVLF